MRHYPVIRTIYLYLFALLGLALLTIGGVRFVDMGLKAFVFTKADQERLLLYQRPPSFYPAPEIEKIQKETKGEKKTCLSEKERSEIDHWLADYEEWKKKKSEINPVAASRDRDASLNLALILIGLPLYLYHWRIIKREADKREDK